MGLGYSSQLTRHEQFLKHLQNEQFEKQLAMQHLQNERRIAREIATARENTKYDTPVFVVTMLLLGMSLDRTRNVLYLCMFMPVSAIYVSRFLATQQLRYQLIEEQTSTILRDEMKTWMEQNAQLNKLTLKDLENRQNRLKMAIEELED